MMIVTERFDTSRKRIDRETKSIIDNILSNVNMVKEGYYPTYRVTDNMQRKAITLSLLNLVFARHIYKYFNEEVLVADIDELLFVVAKEKDEKHINHITNNFRINFNNRNHTDVRNSNSAVGACGRRLFKLLGNSFNEQFDCSRGRIEEIVSTAICCRNVPLLCKTKGYSVEDIDKVNKYLKAMVERLYFSVLPVKEKQEIEKIGDTLIGLVSHGDSFYNYIVVNYEAHRTLLGIKVNTRNYYKPKEKDVIKPCLLLGCSCGSTKPPNWVKTRVYKTTVQITYRCNDCDKDFRVSHLISERLPERQQPTTKK